MFDPKEISDISFSPVGWLCVERFNPTTFDITSAGNNFSSSPSFIYIIPIPES